MTTKWQIDEWEIKDDMLWLTLDDVLQGEQQQWAIRKSSIDALGARGVMLGRNVQETLYRVIMHFSGTNLEFTVLKQDWSQMVAELGFIQD
ncbi:MAG TPA: hypothetical protein VLA39_13470 [Marinobacterium sp.]|nr:hypothetical protein [Marinobacterium sp.]